MRTIKTDTSGNIQVKNGQFVLIDGKDAMVQECWHRAFMFQGDDIFNKDKGIMPLGSLRGGFQTSDILTGQIEALVGDNDEIYDVTATITKTDDKYGLELEVDSFYGRMKI